MIPGLEASLINGSESDIVEIAESVCLVVYAQLGASSFLSSYKEVSRVPGQMTQGVSRVLFLTGSLLGANCSIRHFLATSNWIAAFTMIVLDCFFVLSEWTGLTPSE